MAEHSKFDRIEIAVFRLSDSQIAELIDDLKHERLEHQCQDGPLDERRQRRRAFVERALSTLEAEQARRQAEGQ